MELLIVTTVASVLAVAVPLILFAVIYPRVMFWLDDQSFRREWRARAAQRKAERDQWFADYERRSAELNRARVR